MAEEWEGPRTWIEPTEAGSGGPDWHWGAPPIGAGANAGWPPAGGGGWQPPGWSAPPPPKNRRPRGWLWGVAAVVVVVLVLALVGVVRGHSSSSKDTTLPAPGPSSSSLPGPSASAQPPNSGSGGSGGSAVPVVSCPNIRDEQSHLSYSCIENDLVQGESDTLLGLRISLDKETEPGWVISEGSGNPASVVSPSTGANVRFNSGPATAATAVPVATPSTSPSATPPTAAEVQNEVQQRAELAVSQAYGDSPTAAIAESKSRDFGGVTGYELQLNITINPTYRAEMGLTVKTERLWVVGVPTAAGASIFMLSIPDDRSDLWPKAEATVGTIRVI
ncbi:MAG: hypothetical protein JWO63_2401 [Frankiales bacterium]|jgi:hypothetical protein|nr:hypothetical protein [Frankiales bacterium]